jgi:hypothetical protein
MNTDSAFAMGKRHEVCEDYAKAEIRGGFAQAWVSDGCSSSSDSDIGARLLVLAARQAFQTMLETGWNLESSSPEDIGLMAITQAMMSAGVLDLPTETLDATLLSLVCDGERVCLSAFGDGVMFLKWAGGSTLCLDIELTNGYPDYLSYRLDKSRRDKYDATWKRGGAKLLRGREISPVQKPAELRPHLGYAEIHRLSQGEARLELAAIMSDGVRSFYKRDENGANELIPLGEVLKELLDFKLHTGRFVQRRLNRFLKDAAVRGWEHHDDIAVAAIHFGELA